MKVAELRTHRSGKSFDLKFFEPKKSLITDLENFLPISLRNKLSSNAAAVKDGVSVMIGFESRVGSVSQNEELINLIKDFCVKFKYEYKESVLPIIVKN